MLDETSNGPCLIPHSSFHMFLFPSVRDVPVFQEMNGEQAAWIIPGKTEGGGRRMQGIGMQQGDLGMGDKQVGLVVGHE